MEIKTDNPEHGFQFPGEFEITAMGPAGAGLEDEIPALLEAAGIVTGGRWSPSTEVAGMVTAGMPAVENGPNCWRKRLMSEAAG